MSSASLLADDAHGASDVATESTPLLLNQNHGSEGTSSFCDSDPKGVNRMTMFWEEMRTIPRYTLPIFGSVLQSHESFPRIRLAYPNTYQSLARGVQSRIRSRHFCRAHLDNRTGCHQPGIHDVRRDGSQHPSRPWERSRYVASRDVDLFSTASHGTLGSANVYATPLYFLILSRSSTEVCCDVH